MDKCYQFYILYYTVKEEILIDTLPEDGTPKSKETEINRRASLQGLEQPIPQSIGLYHDGLNQPFISTAITSTPTS